MSYCFTINIFIIRLHIQYLLSVIIELDIVLNTGIISLSKADSIGDWWLNKEIEISLHLFYTNIYPS